jgi:hypothetical protein
VNAVRRLSTVAESERTLSEALKTRLHPVLTQCADIDSRADRTSKPCLLLSCYQAVDCLCFAHPALAFAKRDRRKDKPTAPTENSEQIRCGRCADLHDRGRFARWRPGCRSCCGCGSLFADRMRRRDKVIASRSDLACPVLLIAD